MGRYLKLCWSLFLCVGFAGTAAAAEIGLPAQIGESESSVRQRLGEPDATSYDDWYDLNDLAYKRWGTTIGTAGDTGLVESIKVHSTYRTQNSDWSPYQGMVVEGLGLSASLDDYIRALGSPRTLASDDWRRELSSMPGQEHYAWSLGDVDLVLEVRTEDYTENGVTYPSGSVLTARMTRHEQ